MLPNRVLVRNGVGVGEEVGLEPDQLRCLAVKLGRDLFKLLSTNWRLFLGISTTHRLASVLQTPTAITLDRGELAERTALTRHHGSITSAPKAHSDFLVVRHFDWLIGYCSVWEGRWKNGGRS